MPPAPAVMIVKKHSVLLCPSTLLPLQSFTCHNASNTSSLKSHSWGVATITAATTTTTSAVFSRRIRSRGSRNTKHCNHIHKQHAPRGYATIAGDSAAASNHEEDDYSHLAWPEPPRGHTHPTPYQILALRQKDTYSKQRFYELVKLYHPDRSSSSSANDPSDAPRSRRLPPSHPCRSIPHATRLERYRLIVAANAILSDPAKRRAYDHFGAGWSGTPSDRYSGHNSSSGSSTRPGPFTSGTGPWHAGPEPNIFANATWEDWERFYSRRDGTAPPRQQPVYLSNATFVTLVVCLAMVGSAMNLGRAESHGEKFLEARDTMHDRASKELRRVRQESRERPKDERIQFFVRQREATLLGVGVEEVREERARRCLPPQETCAGGESVEAGGAGDREE